VREDEDVLEGFDDYVEDGRVALGRKAARDEKRRKRKEMEELINQAEGAEEDEEEENDSEVERNEAYEAAQTRAGTYGQHQTPATEELGRPRTPPKITPVPDLSSVLSRMRSGLQEMREAKAAKERKLEELQAEKKEIAEREVWIQSQLKEVGERYEKLRTEAGLTGEMVERNGVSGPVERGLESFGETLTPGLGRSRLGTPVVGSAEA
jgi:DNA repair exonuclease SbcCD ATPase subunit